jgi:hypothetical protein
MKARAGIGIGVVIAFFTALTIASSPQLHEKLHKVDSQHACAATMIASGNCEHIAPPQLVPKLENAPNSPAFLPKRFQFVVASGSFFSPGTRPAGRSVARSRCRCARN